MFDLFYYERFLGTVLRQRFTKWEKSIKPSVSPSHLHSISSVPVTAQTDTLLQYEGFLYVKIPLLLTFEDAYFVKCIRHG